MKNYLRFVGGLYLFWMLFFFFMRLVFIGFQIFCGYHITLFDCLQALFYGAYMDISMTAYFIMLLLLIFFGQSWLPFGKITYYYNLILILIVSVIYAADAVLYKEWGFRLDKTAFSYLTEIREAASFVSMTNGITILLLILCIGGFGWWLFSKLYFKNIQSNYFWVYASNFIILPLLIIPLRGGLDIIPMNPGKVYFSSKPFPNHISLNVPWNIMYSVLQNDNAKSNLHFMDDNDADNTLNRLFVDKNQNVDSILKTKKPKVLFIVLESFTSKLIHRKFKEIDITPRLNEWFDKGIYFNNAYASGDRTEIGIAALFSGFPAQPQSAIVHYTKKTEKLPSLIRTMGRAGYHSTFYYGGDASFANMKSYLFNAGCDVIVDKYEFPRSSYNAKWGVHDHILFERLYDEIVKDSSQFLKICLSLSSHPPYDIPEDPTWQSNEEEILFLNTVHYTDKHLGKLLDKLRQLRVWDDLLIIISADHGGRFPGNDLYHVPAKFKIPIWIGGGAITKPFKIDQVISQVDVSATVLNQLELSNDDFIYSNNLFSKNHKPFAYYAFNNGFGWVDEEGLQVYSNDTKEIILTEGAPMMNIQIGKAFLQNVMREFKRR